MKYTFSELVDIKKVQQLMDSYCQAIGIASAIIDLEGNVLIGTNWQPLCTDFHRVNEQSCQMCLESDTVLANRLQEGEKYTFYECRNGLIDAATPLVIDGEHIANLFVGQFLVESPDLNYFRQQALEYGFDEIAYLEALSRVPVISREKVTEALNFVSEFAVMLGEMGLQQKQHLDHTQRLENEITRRQRVEEELRKLLRAVEQSANTIVITDTEGYIEYVNPKFTETTGYTRAEAIGQHTRILKSGHTPSEAYRDLWETITAGREWRGQFQNKKKNGELYWELASISPIKDENDKIINFLAVKEDITERKRSESALQESERRLADIIDFLPDPVFVIDREGRVLAWNRAMEEMTGATAEEMLGKGNYEYALPFYGERRSLLIDLVFEPHEEVEAKYDLIRRKGDTLFAETLVPFKKGARYLVGHAGALYDSQGNVVGAIETLRDITEEKATEESLRESEARYSAVVEQAHEGVVIIQDQLCVFVNEALADMLGYEPEEIVNSNFAEYVAPESRQLVASRVKARLRGEEVPSVYEARLLRKDGSSFVAELSAGVIQYRGQIADVGVIRDITERKTLERQIQESLARREQQVQISTEVAQEIATAPALDELFRQVVELVQERFDYYHAHLYTLEEEDLVMQEGTGQAGRRMKADGHKIPLATEQSLVARAARRGEPLLVPDVSQESGWLPNPLLPETKSELAVPIKLGDRVLGVLDVQDEAVGSLGEEDQLLLVGLCGQIAVAINNRRIEAERRQIEETLQLTQISVDQSTDSIFWISAQGELLFVNEGACQNLGYTKEELTSLTVHDVDPNFTREIWPHHWRDLKEKRSMVVETEHQTKDGRLIPVEVRITYLKFKDKEYNFAAARDITERKQAEAELESRLHELSALQRLMSREGWQEFQATRSGAAAGYLFDQGAVRPVGSDKPDLPVDTGQARPPLLESAADGRHRIRPLTISGETIGSLGVYDDPDHPLSSEEQEFLDSVSVQVAEALERARLLEQSQSSLSETERLYNVSRRLNEANDLQELVAVVAESGLFPDLNRIVLFGFEYSETGEGETANVIANWHSGQGTHPVALGIQYLWPMFSKFNLFLTETPDFSGDILADETIDPASLAMLRRSNTRAVAVLPLWSGSRQVGALVLESEQPHHFTEREKRTYGALARQVAVAVENQRLFEEMRQALAEVEATQRRYTVQAWESYQTRQVVKSYEQSREGLLPLNGQLPPEVEQAVVQKKLLATSTRTRALKDGEPDPDSPEPGASLVVPLTVRDQIIGVLGLQETDERDWTPEETALVAAIGEQLAQAAEQLRLFDETQQQAARERRVGEIGDKIRAAQSLEEALQVAAKEVGLSLKAPQTMVQLDVSDV